MQAWSAGEVQVPGRLRQLAEAARSGWRRLRATPLGRDFALILALKLVLILALYVFLFRPAFQPRQDAAATAGAIAGVQPDTRHGVPR
jgi:hypothetical protein